MAKYKQTYIPKINTPKEWENLSRTQLRDVVFTYLKNNFANKVIVKNNCLGIDVRITIHASRKTAFGGYMYKSKATVITALPTIIKYAVYNNWGERKAKDSKDIIGYLNFKCKCIINGKKEDLRLAIRVQNDGKFYYNIEVNKKTN